MWVIAGLLIVLISAGVGAVVVGAGDDDGPGRDGVVAGADSTARSTPSGVGSTETVSAPGQGLESLAATPIAPVTCWDDTPAQSLVECSAPAGRAGLEWIFPKMKHQRCDDVLPVDGAAGRLQLWQCYDRLEDGSVLRINYSQWDSVQFLRHQYSVVEGLTEVGISNGLRGWLGIGQGKYKGVLAYVDAPFSVSTYAGTEAERLEAVAAHLPRPVRELMGVANP